MSPLFLHHARLLDPASGLDEVGSVLIEGQQITQLGPEATPPPGCAVLGCHGVVVCPGLVDLGAGCGEPGNEERETLTSLSLAAAAGGFSTAYTLPNTSPAVDSGTVARRLRDAGQHLPGAEVLPMGALTHKCEGTEFADLMDLADSGVRQLTDGPQPLRSLRLLRRALELQAVHGAVILIRPFSPELGGEGVCNEGPVSARLGLPGSPDFAESTVVAQVLEVLAFTGGQVHFSCITTARSLRLLAEARKRGLHVTADVHLPYLLSTEEKTAEFDPNWRLVPPLRSATDRAELIAALKSGLLGALASGHLPCTIEEKEVEFETARPGAATLQHAVCTAVEHLHLEHGLPLATVLGAMSREPLLGLGLRQRHELKVGAPANLTLLRINGESLQPPPPEFSRAANRILTQPSERVSITGVLVQGRLVTPQRLRDEHHAAL